MQLFTSHKFEIITIERKPFVYLLFKEVIDHCKRLAGTGGAEHNRRAERIHHIYPAGVPLLFVVESCGDIYGIIAVR